MDATRAHYDVVIVGAGPAGIFAARELVRRDGASVPLVERGPGNVTCGWGGAEARSRCARPGLDAGLQTPMAAAATAATATTVTATKRS